VVWDPRTGSAVATLVGGVDTTETSEHTAPNGPTYITPILPVKGATYVEAEESSNVALCEHEFLQEEAEEGEPITQETREEAELLCEEPSAQEKAEEGAEVSPAPSAAVPGVLGAPTMDSPKRLTIVDPVK